MPEKKSEALGLDTTAVKNAAESLVAACEAQAGVLKQQARELGERELALTEMETRIRERDEAVTKREKSVVGSVKQLQDVAAERKARLLTAQDNLNLAVEKQKKAEAETRTAIERRDTLEKGMAQLLQDKADLKARIAQLEKALLDKEETEKVVAETVEKVMAEVGPGLEQAVESAVEEKIEDEAETEDAETCAE